MREHITLPAFDIDKYLIGWAEYHEQIVDSNNKQVGHLRISAAASDSKIRAMFQFDSGERSDDSWKTRPWIIVEKPIGLKTIYIEKPANEAIRELEILINEQ